MEPSLFAMQFTSSPRAARLARRLTVRRLEGWGYPPTSDTSGTVALVVAELAANAVRHGRVPGRDFHLRLALDVRTRLIRIEVADASPEPPRLVPATIAGGPEVETGRGLLLVEAVAVRWGTTFRDPVGKTVWAEIRAEAAADIHAEIPTEMSTRTHA